MIKNIFSRYTAKYLRSLVYMLQATEYKVGDYLSWYHNISDFSHIEKRKKLVGTTKAYLLISSLWIIVICACITIYSILLSKNTYLFKDLSIVIIILILPYILGYLIIIPLSIINIAQWPVEYFIIRDARKRVSAHKGIKIGIAGSYGKTTMREILKTVLSEGKNVAAAPHSYNTLLGTSKFIKSLKGNEEVIIFELGEYYPGDIKDLCTLTQPELGIITGINEAHLDKFKSLDSTTKTIFELSDYLGGKPTYLNGDNELVLKNSSTHQILYTAHGCGRWQIENASTDLEGIRFTLLNNELKIEVNSKLLGLHQLGPLAVVAEIASQLGLSNDQIKNGISKTKPFDHRLEPKYYIDGVTILDDSYNGNPDGVIAVITFLESLKGYRRFYMTPGLVEMGKRTEEIHKEIGRRLAKSGIEKVILIKNSVTPYIASGLQESDYGGELILFDDALEAFSALPHITIKGDVILIQNDWPDQYR